MEILPNHDRTFQTTVDLKLSAVSADEWSRYECVFHLPGVKDDIVVTLDKAVIRTNWGKKRSWLNTGSNLSVRDGLIKWFYNNEHSNI